MTEPKNYYNPADTDARGELFRRNQERKELARLATRVEELEEDYANLYSQMRRWPGLQAEITRLRKQNNPCRGHIEDYPKGVCWLCKIKQLREALEDAISMINPYDAEDEIACLQAVLKELR